MAEKKKEPPKKEKLKPPRYTITMRADVQDHEKRRGYGGGAVVHTDSRDIGMAKACGDIEREFQKLPAEPPLIIDPKGRNRRENN